MSPSAAATRATEDLIAFFGRLRGRLRNQPGAGLTPSQTSVLLRLKKDGPSTTTALALAEHVRSPSMTATLNSLDERGLVERTPDPNDRRRQLISLTPTGWEQLERDRDTRYARLAAVMDQRLTSAQLATVNEALALLSALIED